MPDRLHALPPQPCVVRREPPVPANQCQAMLLQYQCSERFPQAGHSSTQQSMYETACNIMLLEISLKMMLTPTRAGCMSIYYHLFETLAFALQSSFRCEPLIRRWGYLSCAVLPLHFLILSFLTGYCSLMHLVTKKKDCGNENIKPKNIVKHNTILNNFIT